MTGRWLRRDVPSGGLLERRLLDWVKLHQGTAGAIPSAAQTCPFTPDLGSEFPGSSPTVLRLCCQALNCGRAGVSRCLSRGVAARLPPVQEHHFTCRVGEAAKPAEVLQNWRTGHIWFPVDSQSTDFTDGSVQIPSFKLYGAVCWKESQAHLGLLLLQLLVCNLHASCR